MIVGEGSDTGDLEPRIQRAVEILEDDAFRAGDGSVTHDRLLSLGEKLRLDPNDIIVVRQRLQDREVEVVGGELPEPSAPSVPAGAADDVEPTDAQLRDTFGIYLREAGEHSLLGREEEQRLMRRLRAGEEAKAKLTACGEQERAHFVSLVEDGERARAQMIESNLRLVISIAKKTRRRGALALQDLIQEGNLGLLRAVSKFDHRRELRFSTYAAWWIRSFIQRATVDKARLVRVPAYLDDRRTKVLKLRSRLTRENRGTAPSVATLAEHLGWEPERVQFLLDIDAPPLSLDHPVATSERATFGDMLEAPGAGPEQQFLDGERKELITDVLATIDERQAAITRRRFGLDEGAEETLQSIGDDLGVTRERIRQIEEKAIDKLRHPSRANRLGELMDGLVPPAPLPPKRSKALRNQQPTSETDASHDLSRHEDDGSDRSRGSGSKGKAKKRKKK